MPPSPPSSPHTPHSQLDRCGCPAGLRDNLYRVEIQTGPAFCPGSNYKDVSVAGVPRFSKHNGGNQGGQRQRCTHNPDLMVRRCMLPPSRACGT
eukprot:scaffold119171_cov21-Tisochrysis_lutea.AAC.2